MADPLAGESEAFADRELLRAFVRGDASSFRTLVARHEALVCSSAARRLRLESGHPKAVDVTRTVFEILSRRPRAVRLKSTLGPWLFEVTRLVCEQVQSGRPAGFWSRLWWKVFRKRSSAGPEVGDDLRARVDPLLDAAVDRLRWVRREVLLLRWQGYGLASMAALLGTSESRVARQMGRGLSQIARRLHRCGVAVTTAELEEIWDGAGRIGAGASAVQECSAANLAWAGGHGAAMGPSRPLVRRVLRTLAWARWRRRVAIGVPAFFLGMALLIGGWWLLDSRDGHSRTLAWFLVWSVKHEAVTVPGLAGPARPWSPEIDRRPPDAGRIREPGELYQMTGLDEGTFGHRMRFQLVDLVRGVRRRPGRLIRGCWSLRVCPGCRLQATSAWPNRTSGAAGLLRRGRAERDLQAGGRVIDAPQKALVADASTQVTEQIDPPLDFFGICDGF